MNTYLTIMVTVLVATQLIRITQNAINLHRQNQSIKRDMGWLKDHYVSEQDFENQRKVFRLLREYLEDKMEDAE